MTYRSLVLGFVAMAAPPTVPYSNEFQRASGPRWLDRAAQVKAESNFNPRAVSNVGAQGLSQFMPATWKWAEQVGWVERGSSPFDPEAAIKAQHSYMNWLEARSSGRWTPALAGYNCGLGSVQRAQRLSHQMGLTGQDAWLTALPFVTGAANARQTTDYITRIHKFRGEYRAAGLK